VGLVGHFPDVADGVARALLQGAARRLLDEGVDSVMGPVDGDTWHRYRFPVGGDESPPFLLEPRQPLRGARQFAEAGFRAVETWMSVRTGTDVLDPASPPAAVRLRGLDRAAFETEVDRLHDVALASFTGAFLYRPLPRHDFHALYAPLRPVLDPAWVRIAEHGGETIGFLLSVPDAANGAVVLKTLAVRPEWRRRGVGRALMSSVLETARGRDVRWAVHALAREGSPSLAYAGPSAVLVRRHAVFAISARGGDPRVG
jgi:GNAT superfamily N-acetyltransferase